MACAPATAHGMCSCYSPWHVHLLQPMACAPATAHGMCTCYSPWHVLLLQPMACAPATAHGMCTCYSPWHVLLLQPTCSCYSPWHVLLLVAKAGQSHSMMSIDRWPTLARYSAVYSGPTLPFYIAMLHCCHILGFGGLHLILHCLHIQGQVLGGLQGTCYCPLCVLLLPALLPTLPPATANPTSRHCPPCLLLLPLLHPRSSLPAHSRLCLTTCQAGG